LALQAKVNDAGDALATLGVPEAIFIAALALELRDVRTSGSLHPAGDLGSNIDAPVFR
jgi:hypothetical protein